MTRFALIASLVLLTTSARAEECNLALLGRAELKALHQVFEGPTSGPLFFANDDAYRQASNAYHACLATRRAAHAAEWTLLENPKPPVLSAPATPR